MQAQHDLGWRSTLYPECSWSTWAWRVRMPGPGDPGTGEAEGGGADSQGHLPAPRTPRQSRSPRGCGAVPKNKVTGHSISSHPAAGGTGDKASTTAREVNQMQGKEGAQKPRSSTFGDSLGASPKQEWPRRDRGARGRGRREESGRKVTGRNGVPGPRVSWTRVPAVLREQEHQESGRAWGRLPGASPPLCPAPRPHMKSPLPCAPDREWT